MTPKEFIEFTIKQNALDLFQVIWEPMILDPEVSGAELRMASQMWSLALNLAVSDPAMGKELIEVTQGWHENVLYPDLDLTELKEWDQAVRDKAAKSHQIRAELLAEAIKKGFVDGE